MSNRPPRHPPGAGPIPAGDDAATNPVHDFVSGESSMRHTRHATVATIAIAFGLALTTIGISRALPHEIGGMGSKLTVAADAWASGSAISPPLVLLVAVGLLAAIAMRETRGGVRAARWLAVLAGLGIVAGLMEPVQQRILLFQEPDLLLAITLYASSVAWIALVVACVLRVRDGRAETGLQVAAPELVAAAA
jgi:hypothetical protein